MAKRLIDHESKTSNQIIIITVDLISPYSNVQEYATAIGNYWGLGQKNKDNGLTIVYSDDLRQVAIATGNGTQKILTDSVCQQIIDHTIIPKFKNQEYYRGIFMGVDSQMRHWK